MRRDRLIIAAGAAVVYVAAIIALPLPWGLLVGLLTLPLGLAAVALRERAAARSWVEAPVTIEPAPPDAPAHQGMPLAASLHYGAAPNRARTDVYLAEDRIAWLEASGALRSYGSAFGDRMLLTSNLRVPNRQQETPHLLQVLPGASDIDLQRSHRQVVAMLRDAGHDPTPVTPDQVGPMLADRVREGLAARLQDPWWVSMRAAKRPPITGPSDPRLLAWMGRITGPGRD